MIHIGVANQAEIDALWPAFARRFQRGCERCGGDTTAGQLYQMARRGDALMIVALDDGKPVMASLWRFEAWGNDAVLKCLGLAGENPKTWAKEARRFAEKLRDDGGASRFIFEGRDWRPFFPDAKEIRRVYEVK